MKSQTTALPSEGLERIHELYRQNKFVCAYEYSKSFGPLESWRGTEALLLAGRLAAHLGGRELAQKLHCKAFLRDRSNQHAQYYFAWTILNLRGPMAAWNWLKRFANFDQAAPVLRADMLALQARLAYLLRDFKTAEELLGKADALNPNHDWLLVERAFLLEAEDRYEEALEMAQQSLTENQWYRPGVNAVAHMLQLLNRDDQAVELLTEAAHHIEGTSVHCELAGLHLELKQFAEAKMCLERGRANAPLMDEGFELWWNANRADVEYFCGNFAAAAEFAKQVKGPFYQKFAEKLALPRTDHKRVELPVGFVRQHHMTCAPATLSALSKFWGKPAEHLSLAETICYDGTPAHSERAWAEKNGWIAREFKVTQACAQQLLQRGIPFTLTTVEPGSAHLQAVIGFDDTRECLIVRDPYRRRTHEFRSDKALEHYASSGPRGMTLVPIEKAALLDGIELPEADLYDVLYQLNDALERHDRVSATTNLEQLQKSAPEHRITLQAQRTLASYDANSTEQLAAMEKLLQQFPKDTNLQLARLSCLRNLATREKRVGILKEICDDKESDPLIWREYAYELSLDGREFSTALRWLNRFNRYRGLDSHGLYLKANLLWSQREFVEATELYRFAASLDDKKEYLAMAYFHASRYLKETDRAIAFLVERCSRLGKLSHQPAATLYSAYLELSKTREAFDVLESALKLRPEDGELLLYAADAYARHNNSERARVLLNSAESRTQRMNWLRAAATLADYSGELKVALETWKQVLETEPLALDANRSVARLTAETESRAAAVHLLQEACKRFPHHFALHTVLLDWLRRDGDAVMELVIRRLIEIDPINAWAHRELALALGNLQKFDAALAEAALAITLDPADAAGFNVRGCIYLQQGDREKAKVDLRRAISIAVDSGSAINDLLEACSSLPERKEAIAFIEQELIRQVVFGEGLLAFRDAAKALLAPEELLTALQKALTARPDLWHAWSAVIHQLTDMQRFDDALKLATDATQHFPLLSRLWLDFARVHRARLDGRSEVEAIEKAVQLSPGWGYAVRQLSDAFERLGDLESAKRTIQNHIAHAPLDSFSHGYLADILWRQGEKSAALARLQQALQLNSEYDWAWNTADRWASELNQPDLTEKLARELTESRPGQAQNWVVLARALDSETNGTEVMAAVDRALALSPRDLDAWDLKIVLLTNARNFKEAHAACRPPVFGDKVPTTLRAREAWVFMRQSKMDEAIRHMQTVVADDPSHYWAWKQLADWLWETGSHKEAVEAAGQLSRLAPFDPIPLGYAGYMKQRLKDNAGAKVDFERAMKLDPTYTFAGFRLFDLQMEDGESTAAEETLRFLRQHNNTDELTAREMRVFCQTLRWKEAEAALEKLCLSREKGDWPLQAARYYFGMEKRAKRFETILKKHLRSAEANPNIGAAWVTSRMDRKKWVRPGALDKLMARGPIHQNAVVHYIEVLGEKHAEAVAAGDRSNPLLYRFLLSRLLRKHASMLKADDRAWGKVGYALASQNRMKDVIEWMGEDWNQRKDLESWMLYNLATALRSRGRDAEALEVCRHGLTLEFDNDIHQRFCNWIAFHEALAGNTSEAKRYVERVKSDGLPEKHKWLEAFNRAMLTVQGVPSGERLNALKEARKIIKDIPLGGVLKTEKEVRRCYWRALKRMKFDCGSAKPLLWGMFHEYGILTVALPIAFVSLVALFFQPEFGGLIFMLSMFFSLIYYARRR